MKIKAVIIDDEKNGRVLLADLLQEYAPDVEVAGEAGDPETGAEVIRRLEPDLVFLDVEMPTGTGFDLLEALPDRNFEVIFITAYNQYAINAFTVHALDYLLKPINIERLQQAVASARKRIADKQKDDRLQFLLDQVQGRTSRNGTLVLPTIDGFRVLKLEHLVRAESETNYTRFFLDSGEAVLVSKTMKEFEPALVKEGFCRIHRSHLVNLNYVRRYFRGRGGQVELADGTTLPVSRDRKEAFLEAILPAMDVPGGEV